MIRAVESINIIKAGNDFIKGSLILIWTPIAPIIRHPIKKADISTKSGYHIPKINKHANANLENPIIFITELLKP